MKFVMNRDRIVNSVLGHAIEFKKGQPTHVPPALYEEVMSAGAVPEEELAEDEKPQPKLSAEDRKVLIVTAIEEIVLKNDPKEFTAAGMPHTKVISAKVGFDVAADERDAAWAAFQAAKKD
ncbi:MAG: hypothetical protein JSS14_21895 [Proteobacteria bacterium]|nr:hypothetical protein [Pseudomonadota bacterium]